VNYFLSSIFLILAIIFIPYFYSSFKLINPSKINKPDYGKFAELKNGNIFYQEFSSNNPIGQIVVLVHGFSTPSIVWKGIVPFLTDAGYDVVSYDHYGRGFSARPKVDYTKDFYISTLLELIDHLKIEQKVHLIGYSMGGPIVGYFANENPNKVESVNFIAPAGYMFKRKSQSNIYLKILNIPFITKYISVVFPSLMYGGSSSIKLSTDEDQNRLSQNELNNVYREQMKYEGFTRSLVSTAKNFNLFNTQKMYKELGKKKINASVIWGNVDEIVPFDGLSHLKADYPNINFEVIVNGHHDITYALPSVVGQFFSEQLKSFSNSE
jgi:pimeloyl-ACP methyl ester carboxylesterase